MPEISTAELSRNHSHVVLGQHGGERRLRRTGALRASRRKTFLHTEAIPRWQFHSLESMGNGGTHEAWQAASNRLKSLRNQVYDDFQSSSYGCLTVTYFHPSLSSSLAAHEGQTLKYQHLSRTVPECRPIAANRGTYRAA
jgi:hypothetical protein